MNLLIYSRKRNFFKTASIYCFFVHLILYIVLSQMNYTINWFIQFPKALQLLKISVRVKILLKNCKIFVTSSFSVTELWFRRLKSTVFRPFYYVNAQFSFFIATNLKKIHFFIFSHLTYFWLILIFFPRSKNHRIKSQRTKNEKIKFMK